jgi:molybdopterin-guanine dinucleotide biosynthesis protein MobB
MNKTPAFGISGWKNSGKTGLTVRLVEELTARGYRISTIKHAGRRCRGSGDRIGHALCHHA